MYKHLSSNFLVVSFHSTCTFTCRRSTDTFHPLIYYVSFQTCCCIFFYINSRFASAAIHLRLFFFFFYIVVYKSFPTCVFLLFFSSLIDFNKSLNQSETLLKFSAKQVQSFFSTASFITFLILHSKKVCMTFVSFFHLNWNFFFNFFIYRIHQRVKLK